MKALKLSALSTLGLYRPSPAVPGLDEEVAEALREVRYLLGQLSGADVRGELTALARQLSDHSGELRAAILVWVDVIESLVQDAEGRHPRPGRGTLKLAEVKWVVAYLISSGRFRIPRVPSALQPLVADVLADVTVNAFVALLKDHELLVGLTVSRSTRLSGAARWWWHQLWRPVAWVLRPLGNGLSKMYVALRFHRPASPALRSALAALGEVDAGSASVFSAIESFVSWLAANPDVIGALSRLIGLAVTEVERWSSLDGPGKKRLAEDVIVDALADFGVGEGVGGSVVVRAVVDIAVDAVVAIFNKREFFTHSAG